MMIVNGTNDACASANTQGESVSMRYVVAWITGMVEALLLVRIVVRLLAARPDNSAIEYLVALTDPAIEPLRFLDAGQPRFGATFEVSTLALMFIVLIAGYLVWLLVGRFIPGAKQVSVHQSPQ